MLEDTIFVRSVCEQKRSAMPHLEIMAKEEGKVPRGPQVEVVVKHTVELWDTEDLGDDSVKNAYTRPILLGPVR